MQGIQHYDILIIEIYYIFIKTQGGGWNTMAETTAATGIFSNQQIITPTFKEQAYQLIKDAIIYQR